MTGPASPGRGSSVLLAEMFGPTLQGEGPSCGQQALFIRLSRCNLSCPNCDTPYTWDWTRFSPQTESRRMEPAQIVSWVLACMPALVVITGGEPLLQQRNLVPVVEALAGSGRRVEIETNGTVAPEPAVTAAVAAFNVSPKLAGFAAAADQRRRLDRPALQVLRDTGKAVFKFVVTGVDDLDEIGQLADELELDPVWVMPEGSTSERTLATMRDVADEVVRRGWHLTSRLHVLLWGDARGR